MPKRGFNLLREQVEPPTVWNKLYDYVVGTARVIVIVVELVVVGAFAVRLVVDAQSKTLDEQIQVKENILRSFQDAEGRYRKIQQKTGTLKATWVSSPVLTPLFTEINSYLPSDAIDLIIDISKDTIDISGIASNAEIGKMEKKLKDKENFETQIVGLESSGNQATVQSNFSVKVKVKIPSKREIVIVESPVPTPTIVIPSTTL